MLAGLGLPEGVRELVARRVSRLPDDVQRTLSLAAVVGPEFGVNVLTRSPPTCPETQCSRRSTVPAARA